MKAKCNVWCAINWCVTTWCVHDWFSAIHHVSMETNQKLRTAFGQRVRVLRKQKGFSQESFADECKLVRTYMSRIENGTANPSLEAAKVLADKLGMTLSELLEGL